jgi:streptogramin lyase
MILHLILAVQITTFAGTGKAGFSGDGGSGTKAEMKSPHGLQFGPDGALYISDIGNRRIRRVDMKTGIITSFTAANEAAEASTWSRSIDFDSAGDMWLVRGNAVFKLDIRSRTIRQIAGAAKAGFTGNGGRAKDATLSGPKGIAVAPNGNVYLADTESHSVRMIDVKTGKLELVAGTGEKGDGPDGDPLACKMNRLHGIFVDSDGSVFIGDTSTHRVRVIRTSR